MYNLTEVQVDKLRKGEEYHYNDMLDIFNGMDQSGIYKPSSRNYAVIKRTSDSIYNDSSDSSGIVYQGQGRNGDQSLSEDPNDFIKEISDGEHDAPIFAFNKVDGEWLYEGLVHPTDYNLEYSLEQDRMVVLFQFTLLENSKELKQRLAHGVGDNLGYTSKNPEKLSLQGFSEDVTELIISANAVWISEEEIRAVVYLCPELHSATELIELTPNFNFQVYIVEPDKNVPRDLVSNRINTYSVENYITEDEIKY